MKQVVIYDSTLRDGAQAQGISYTVEDKLKIVDRLDRLGVSYIEAGNPGSNPKDLEFFERAKKIDYKNAKLIAFGSTRKVNIKVQDDANVCSLLAAGTAAVAIFGKSWDFQVTDILRTTLDENLNMIFDTVKFFKDKGIEVVYDAEHFFDGYSANTEYAVKTLKAAADAGASRTPPRRRRPAGPGGSRGCPRSGTPSCSGRRRSRTSPGAPRPARA